MSDDLKRTVQRSIRLNEAEVAQADGLIGYRGLWEFSELVRAGLQLLLQAEQEDLKQLGETGARKRATVARKKEKS